jgi:hypothetical protein
MKVGLYGFWSIYPKLVAMISIRAHISGATWRGGNHGAPSPVSRERRTAARLGKIVDDSGPAISGDSRGGL